MRAVRESSSQGPKAAGLTCLRNLEEGQEPEEGWVRQGSKGHLEALSSVRWELWKDFEWRSDTR